mmetsp:Transcript_83837/g.241041  ORF Transcript_83837/g.241041 Transcript_83837/m.241041 type:complete len:350 (-) Transcript_83837:159-1208(-)
MAEDGEFEPGQDAGVRWPRSVPLAVAGAACCVLGGAVCWYALRAWRRREDWLLRVLRWLTWRMAFRVMAWGALLSGLIGIMAAAGRFCKAHWDVPKVLLSLTVASYGLLVLAPLLAAAGLKWKAVPKAHKGFRQASKAALLGGLAAGQAVYAMCNLGGHDYRNAPLDFREACGVLGASSGVLLLGLLAAQMDGQASRGDCGDEGDAEDGLGDMLPHPAECDEEVMRMDSLGNVSIGSLGSGLFPWAAGSTTPFPASASSVYPREDPHWPSLLEACSPRQPGLAEPLMGQHDAMQGHAFFSPMGPRGEARLVRLNSPFGGAACGGSAGAGAASGWVQAFSTPPRWPLPSS